MQNCKSTLGRIVNTRNKGVMLFGTTRVYLKTPNASGQRAFSRRAAGYFASFQIHP